MFISCFENILVFYYDVQLEFVFLFDFCLVATTWICSHTKLFVVPRCQHWFYFIACCLLSMVNHLFRVFSEMRWRIFSLRLVRIKNWQKTLSIKMQRAIVSKASFALLSQMFEQYRKCRPFVCITFKILIVIVFIVICLLFCQTWCFRLATQRCRSEWALGKYFPTFQILKFL